MTLIYTDKAVKDLKRLRAFIAENAPDSAARIAAELIEEINHLSGFPLLGRAIDHPSAPESFRDLITERYIVRYQIQENSVLILRIWHHRENWNT